MSRTSDREQRRLAPRYCCAACVADRLALREDPESISARIEEIAELLAGGSVPGH